MRARLSAAARAMPGLAALAAVALLVAPAAAAEADAPPALRACLDADDPPFSSAATPERGIDLEVAREVAARLGRTLQPVWVPVPARGGLGKALRQSIAAGRCDAWVGIPGGADMARELADRRLVATGPYLSLGYVFVADARNGPPADPRRARRIGAVTETPADLWLHRRQLHRAPYPDGGALISALKSGEIDLALVWAPALVGVDGLAIGVEPPADPSLAAELTVATRADDAVLSRALAQAVDALRAEGRFHAIAARHGLPDRPLP